MKVVAKTRIPMMRALDNSNRESCPTELANDGPEGFWLARSGSWIRVNTGGVSELP
jgi:hypothetical protein